MKISKNTLGYAVLAGLLVVASIFSLNLFLRQRAQRDIVDIHNFPLSIGEWSGKDVEIPEKDYEILETRNLILRNYTNRSGDRIALFIVYSETNRSVFHPPEVCMIGSGIDISDKIPEKINLEGRSFFVNRMRLEEGNTREVVLYCYKAADLYTDSYPLQQAYFAVHQLFGKRVRGATIRVSMLMKGDEQATLSKLKSFLVDAIRIIDSLK